MTFAARAAIIDADVVVGYDTYLDLVRGLLTTQAVIGTGMTRELERCQAAIDAALTGKKVAVISGGDPGVYGMAGIVLELLHKRGLLGSVAFTVVPGVTAVTAAAAVLGAPVMHDFAVISLSDLLTPWEKIRQRVEAAARADFVIALYNPKSARRVHQIQEVQAILLAHRPPSTPVGIVCNALRTGERMSISNLGEFTAQPIDMFSLVIVGNSQTYRIDQFLVTPRGYSL